MKRSPGIYLCILARATLVTPAMLLEYLSLAQSSRPLVKVVSQVRVCLKRLRRKACKAESLSQLQTRQHTRETFQELLERIPTFCVSGRFVLVPECKLVCVLRGELADGAEVGQVAPVAV
uniref:Uncharacterized protein n=1 Tax=Ixodes ricinus TaxID=34613 RepID=A0A6B0UN21_IXORI